MRVSGIARVPGDKSISHRALILAALAEGESRISRLLDSADVRSTMGALRALGVETETTPSGDLVVRGRGAASLREPRAALDCGNSGTTTRLMAGVAAACAFRTRFEGDASLSRRPMRRVAEPLQAMGARVALTAAGTLPMEIEGGSLHETSWTTGVASAQVKGAILLAGVAAGVRVAVREPAPSRDHSERMLRAMGADVSARGGEVVYEPGAPLRAVDRTVPGDPSSAAFFVALAALAPAGEIALPDVCVNPTRTGFLDVMRRMGASVAADDERDDGGEAIATLRAGASALRGVDVRPEEVPAMIDELPLLACVAARADGTTTVAGAAELRVKESDRIAATVAALRAVGADAEERPDGFVVVGSDRPLHGRVVTHGDHRLAMAFGILGALPGNQIVVDDPDCVAVSYPGFWRDLALLAGGAIARGAA
ncbi:MAG TPA: 3-phosphoshikimate 1-carboxyvinyltransferase [Gemmatimonadaceae bacterium]|nr:3-phosphoshikimate 1-carboxyvinyltransferase [Gemmatimonadaceae bacterium]